MKISKELLDQLVAHVLEDPANEICGVVAVESDGAPPGERRAVRVYPARNLHLSPLRFEIDPKDLLRLSNEIDDRGWEIGAIYHSHVRSEPAPSQTDINYAANWPGVEWIIVGLADGAPEVRSHLIEDGHVREVSPEVQ
ncbi:MAG TPA: M67 family metallopeptidase [Solirubrobacteraceae bacterium]|jgi:proteasome lid subunit RPN8/RPN11|nr:M67 family metallopeptidase [Solirubrobacteraceae bacterium]